MLAHPIPQESQIYHWNDPKRPRNSLQYRLHHLRRPAISYFLGKNESRPTLSRRGGSTVTPHSHHHDDNSESQYGLLPQRARVFIFHEGPQNSFLPDNAIVKLHDFAYGKARADGSR